MKLLIPILLALLVGCATMYATSYNIDDAQDPNCYKSYQGIKGYCDL